MSVKFILYAAPNNQTQATNLSQTINQGYISEGWQLVSVTALANGRILITLNHLD